MPALSPFKVVKLDFFAVVNY